jgi:periplasmic protein CpxP/Spy
METVYKNKWLGIVMLVLLTANIVTLALLLTNNKNANPALPLPPHAGGPAFEFVIKELSLDEEQQEIYKQLREEHQQQQRPIADSLAKSRNDYFDLLKDTAVSESKLLAYNNRTMQFQQQMELMNFKHFQKLRAICASTQQQKFDSIIQEVLKRLGGRRPMPPNGERGMRPHEEGDEPPPP